MNLFTVSAKGEVTLSPDILEHLGVKPGEKIAIEKLPDGRIEAKAASPTGHISDVFGILKRKNGPRLSIDDLKKFSGPK